MQLIQQYVQKSRMFSPSNPAGKSGALTFPAYRLGLTYAHSIYPYLDCSWTIERDSSISRVGDQLAQATAGSRLPRRLGGAQGA